MCISIASNPACLALLAALAKSSTSPVTSSGASSLGSPHKTRQGTAEGATTGIPAIKVEVCLPAWCSCIATVLPHSFTAPARSLRRGIHLSYIPVAGAGFYRRDEQKSSQLLSALVGIYEIPRFPDIIARIEDICTRFSSLARYIKWEGSR